MQIILRLPDDSTSIGLRDKVLLCIMYATGARAQEICDLAVSNVRFSDKGATIDIIGKGNKCRRIRISSHSAGILKKYIIHKGIEHSPNRHIFSSQTHEHMTISCIEELVKKYVFKAKALHPDKFIKSRYSPHSIRHTTAVHMLESGVPLMVIKNFLGHSSIQTTQVYAELTQNTVDKHIQQWNEKWFPHEINPESIRPRPDRMPDFLRP